MEDNKTNMDSLLYLEEDFYKEGYKEGQEKGAWELYREGKQYGYQTGFQRFLIVGYIRALVERWKNECPQNEENKNIRKHLDNLEGTINSILKFNNEKDVREFEKKLSKSKNKIRMVAYMLKKREQVDKLDEYLNEIGGGVQVSRNSEEMW